MTTQGAPSAFPGRPCRYCVAAYPILFEGGETDSCEVAHRDEKRIYDLAIALAAVFQGTSEPADEQVCWFLADAEAVADDFGPAPEKWHVRKLPDSGGFVARMRINDVTYVVEDGEGHIPPVRLSALRKRQREAERVHGRQS